MEPYKLASAIEENIVEVFSWLFLFPLTLLDVLVHPDRFLDKTSRILASGTLTELNDRMTPVLFMLAGTIPLSITIVKLGGDADAQTMPSVADAALVLALVVGACPCLWAVLHLVATRRPLARETFRLSFGTQCYVFCPPWFGVLLLSALASGDVINLERTDVALCALLILLALLVWVMAVEWRLLSKAAVSRPRALMFVAAELVASMTALAVIQALARATGQTWLS